MGGTLIMKMVFKFVADYWQIIVLALLVIFLFFYWHNRTKLIEDQQSQISTLTTDLATEKTNCKRDKQLLVEQITQQNIAIQAFQNQVNNNQHKLDQVNSDIIRMRKAYGKEMDSIFAETTPKDCSTAIKYLIDAAGSFDESKSYKPVGEKK
jgi:septal ring factor EnvC (AmiA/AmiB activator)